MGETRSGKLSGVNAITSIAGDVFYVIREQQHRVTP